jgi:ATP-binding cassette subfamily B protein
MSKFSISGHSLRSRDATSAAKSVSEPSAGTLRIRPTRRSPGHSPLPDGRDSGVRGMVSKHRGAVAGLALTSVVGAFFEATFLVTVTRVAFAITDGEERFGIVAGLELAVGEAIALSALLVVGRVALAVAGAWLATRLSTKVLASLRTELAGAFLGANWASQHGERTGRLQELLTTFVGQGAGLIGAVAQVIVSGCSLAALLLMAFLVDPWSALVVAVVVLLIGVLLRPVRAAAKRQSRRTAATGMEFATSLSEISQLGMEMHVFNVQPATEHRVRQLIDHAREANQRLGRLKAMVPSLYIGIAYLGIVGALAIAFASETANLDTVGAVMLVMLRSLSYGQGMQVAITSIQSALPFVGALDQELDRYRAAAVVDHGQPIGEIGALELQDVSFEYVPEVPVLRHVTATVGRHEAVGVIGPSGSGKSTLVQLLLGLREPTSGLVLAGGRDIRVLSKTEWARKVTFVPQQAHLIAGTVADNIRFLREGVTDGDIERAARMAQLHGDVEAWPEGYERQVGEQGSHLSGGQQQRLIIARALVEHPDLLILDEPTSALDVRSEALIRQTLDQLRSEMTVIIIAHRLSTLDLCDRIMVIQDGELRAFDTPENLEKDNEFFQEALRLSRLR